MGFSGVSQTMPGHRSTGRGVVWYQLTAGLPEHQCTLNIGKAVHELDFKGVRLPYPYVQSMSWISKVLGFPIHPSRGSPNLFLKVCWLDMMTLILMPKSCKTISFCMGINLYSPVFSTSHDVNAPAKTMILSVNSSISTHGILLKASVSLTIFHVFPSGNGPIEVSNWGLTKDLRWHGIIEPIDGLHAHDDTLVAMPLLSLMLSADLLHHSKMSSWSFVLNGLSLIVLCHTILGFFLSKTLTNLGCSPWG